MNESWFRFGFDQINGRVIALSVSSTKDEAERLCSEMSLKESVYDDVRVFNLMSQSGAADFKRWLMSCKLSDREIKNVINGLWQIERIFRKTLQAASADAASTGETG